MGRLLVVTGTATEIGKTHVSEALLLAAGERHRAVGVKPIESGGVSGGVSDGQRLPAASSFHVKNPAPFFAPPVSPHLAAREAGVDIDVPKLATGLTALRSDADLLLVELPGGLFTP